MTISIYKTPNRELGKTETNWCAALDSGTGISLCTILFEKPIPLPHIQASLHELLAVHPRLRSEIAQKDSKFFFETPEKVSVNVAVIDRSLNAQPREDEEEGINEGASELWHAITEEEMNISFPREYPFPVFGSKLYLLPNSQSLLVIRVHAAAGDMASMAIISKQVVSSLQRSLEDQSKGPETTQNGLDDVQKILEAIHVSEEREEDVVLPSIESTIPHGQANKPFWAHGVDVVGYGLVSRRHAYLPFDNPNNGRSSRLIRAALTAEATDILLEECEKRGVSIYGAINAAGLKAVAAAKRVGERGEHYGTAVLLQCRHRLQPVVPDSSIGFYQAAMLRTHHTTETIPFWELAKRCSKDFDDAVKNRKHFTDMGDLNALMVQAMNFPQLTPNGSLRTTLLSMTSDPVYEDLGKAAAVVGVKDYLACSSTHGVGPCLAIFPFMREGALQFSFVYSSPLFSRSKTQKLVDSILSYLFEE